jgi:hypothetical protein
MILRRSTLCYSEVSGFDLGLSTLGGHYAEGGMQKAEGGAEGRCQQARQKDFPFVICRLSDVIYHLGQMLSASAHIGE